MTYERRGCTKKGVEPKKHGIVYVEGKKPKSVRNEPELGVQPIKVKMDVPGEQLAPESRVNYSKLITVEHNVKVFFVGHVSKHDFDTVVRPAIDKCWGERITDVARERKR